MLNLNKQCDSLNIVLIWRKFFPKYHLMGLDDSNYNINISSQLIINFAKI